MPTYNSPGSYVIEKDFSEYPVAVNSSIAGIVGFAAAGPENKATLITSTAQLVRTFGTPDVVSGGQGLLAAMEILSRTNAIYFVRAATSNAADASATVSFGACPAVYVSGIAGDAEIAWTFSSTDETGASNSPFSSDGYLLTVAAGTAGSGSAQVADAVAKVQTSDWPFSFEQDTASTGWFIGSHAGSGASLHVSGGIGGTPSLKQGPVSANTGELEVGAGDGTAHALAYGSLISRNLYTQGLIITLAP